jgi:hypothetical protein
MSFTALWRAFGSKLPPSSCSQEAKPPRLGFVRSIAVHLEGSYFLSVEILRLVVKAYKIVSEGNCPRSSVFSVILG